MRISRELSSYKSSHNYIEQSVLDTDEEEVVKEDDDVVANWYLA